MGANFKAIFDFYKSGETRACMTQVYEGEDAKKRGLLRPQIFTERVLESVRETIMGALECSHATVTMPEMVGGRIQVTLPGGEHTWEVREYLEFTDPTAEESSIQPVYVVNFSGGWVNRSDT